MKKKYLITSLLIIFLLTGCKAKYSLEIKDGIIKETLKVTENSNSERVTEKDDFDYSFYDYSRLYGEANISTEIEEYYSEDKCKSNCSYYQKEFINDNGVIGFELSNEFTFDKFKAATVANELIPAFSSLYDGKYLKISGGPNWNYFKDYKYLENIDISIETNYKVVSTNMKQVSDGKYEKQLSEDDPNIYITLDTDVVYEKIEDSDNSNLVMYLIIFVGVLFVALFICVFKDRKKYR